MSSIVTRRGGSLFPDVFDMVLHPSPMLGRGSLLDAMPSLFNELRSNLLDETSSALRGAPRTHPTDVSERDNAYTLTTDAPGFAPDDVKVELHEGVLTISGEKRSEERQEEGGVLRRERVMSTSFRRAFRLPDNANADAISAQLEQGVLKVVIPKLPEQRAPAPRTIAVQAAAAPAKTLEAAPAAGGVQEQQPLKANGA